MEKIFMSPLIKEKKIDRYTEDFETTVDICGYFTSSSINTGMQS